MPHARRPSAVPRDQRKLRRQAEILEAAFEEFSRHGYAAARLDDVAERVGVTKGTIYFYFEDKEHLFREVVRSVLQPVLHNVEALVHDFGGSSEELLRQILTAIQRGLSASRKAPRLMRLMLAESQKFPELAKFYYEEVIAHGTAILSTALKRGVERGEFRQTGAANFPQLVIGPCMFAVLWNLIFGRWNTIETEPYVEAHLDLLLNGLKARHYAAPSDTI